MTLRLRSAHRLKSCQWNQNVRLRLYLVWLLQAQAAAEAKQAQQDIEVFAEKLQSMQVTASLYLFSTFIYPTI